MNVLLDAGVVVALACKPERAPNLWKHGGEAAVEGRCALSAISLDELLRSCDEDSDGAIRARRMAVIGAVVDRFEILPVDETVIRVHAILREGFKKNKGSLGYNEGWIAATCLAHGFTLVTDRHRTFRKIKNLPLRDF